MKIIMGHKTLLTHESAGEAEAKSSWEHIPGNTAVQSPRSWAFYQAIEVMPVNAKLSVWVKLQTDPTEEFLCCSAFSGICTFHLFLKHEIRLCDHLCFAQY